MSYDPRARSNRPGHVRFAAAGEQNVKPSIRVGPFRTTVIGLILAGLVLIAFGSLLYSFFSGNLGAFVFWVVVELLAGGIFVWDRKTNLPKEEPAAPPR
jgi:hypothetical protein